MLETLDLVHSNAALQSFNVTTSATAEAIEPEDDESTEQWFLDECLLVQRFWKLLTEVASARSWSQVQFQVCQPNALAIALHTDRALAQRSLREQRNVWNAVIQAERAAAPDSTLEHGLKESLGKLLLDLGWNRLQVARESFLVCQAAGWDVEHPEVQSQARCIFSGPAQTKWELEDLFAHLASVARSANLPTAMNKFRVRI